MANEVPGFLKQIFTLSMTSEANMLGSLEILSALTLEIDTVILPRLKRNKAIELIFEQENQFYQLFNLLFEKNTNQKILTKVVKTILALSDFKF